MTLLTVLSLPLPCSRQLQSVFEHALLSSKLTDPERLLNQARKASRLTPARKLQGPHRTDSFSQAGELPPAGSHQPWQPRILSERELMAMNLEVQEVHKLGYLQTDKHEGMWGRGRWSGERPFPPLCIPLTALGFYLLRGGVPYF